jgi:hypothetical protein
MQDRRWVLAALVWSVAGVTACGDDTVLLLPQDAGNDLSVADGTADGTSSEGAPFEAGMYVDSPGPDSGDASIPTRLLLSYNGSAQSELVAFGLQSGAVEGRLTYDDTSGGAYVGATFPWLLEQYTDRVGRLDPQSPWVVDSSWNVALNDYVADAGYAESYSDPTAVVAGAGTTAFVFRYTRNHVAIIDSSQDVDGGAPTGSIDLSGYEQDGGDGYVQPVAAVYVATQQRIYALLANINRFDAYGAGCTSDTPVIVAIDTTSNTLVDLGGSAPGHAWPLLGYGPVLGPGAMVFDPLSGTNGRFLVLESGCNTTTSDGGEGPLVKAEVEAIDLATGQSTMLLDLTGATFPNALTYIDAHHAIVQLDNADFTGFISYAWDPTTTTLGSVIPNAPDAFAYDGQGHLLGVAGEYGSDGGMTGYEVVSVTLADGGLTQLVSNPFTIPLANGFLQGATLWPAP